MTYKRNEKSQATLDAAMNRILDAFVSGQLAAPLADTFIRGGTHMERWGIWNQILVLIHGAEDAATEIQWNEMGRQVKDRSAAIWLMNPIYGKYTTEDENGEEKAHRWIRGFGHFRVFPLSSTEPIPDFSGQSYDDKHKIQDRTEFVRSLPFLDVAHAWGLSVRTYNGQQGGARGWYAAGSGIGLGTKNLATWAHELVHAAEDRLGMLTERGQDRAQEIVAEWGGAVLLTVCGMEVEADLGGALSYIRSYAKDKTPEGVVKEVRALAWRVQQAVKHILEAAEELQSQPAVMEVGYV